MYGIEKVQEYERARDDRLSRISSAYLVNSVSDLFSEIEQLRLVVYNAKYGNLRSALNS